MKMLQFDFQIEIERDKATPTWTVHVQFGSCAHSSAQESQLEQLFQMQSETDTLNATTRCDTFGLFLSTPFNAADKTEKISHSISGLRALQPLITTRSIAKNLKYSNEYPIVS